MREGIVASRCLLYGLPYADPDTFRMGNAVQLLVVLRAC